MELRQISDRFSYLTELADRRQVILDSIESQGKLTPALKQQMRTVNKKRVRRSLSPFRPKRRTRATIAREKKAWVNGKLD